MITIKIIKIIIHNITVDKPNIILSKKNSYPIYRANTEALFLCYETFDVCFHREINWTFFSFPGMNELKLQNLSLADNIIDLSVSILLYLFIKINRG